ncbi:hypothetical protein ACET3Z_031452 [Daucus carota]
MTRQPQLLIKLVMRRLHKHLNVVIGDELVELMKLSLVLGERVENALGGFASYVAEERNALKRLRNAALRDPGTIILGTITINYKGSPCYMAPEVLKHNYSPGYMFGVMIREKELTVTKYVPHHCKEHWLE